MAAAIDTISHLQRWAYTKTGQDPNLIPQSIDALRGKQRGSGFLRMDQASAQLTDMADPVFGEYLDQVYKEFRTTPYQDPVILGGMASEWERIQWVAKRNFPQQVARIRTPVLGSIPLSTLNGFCFLGEDEVPGIVLQDGLRFLPGLLADAVATYLLDDADGKAPECNLDLDRLSKVWREGVEQGFSWGEKVFDYFYADAVEDGLPQMPADRQARIRLNDPALYRATRLIESGFRFMLLAHEYAHCLAGHLEGNGMSPLGAQIRDEALIQQTIAQIHDFFPGQDLPTDTQLACFTSTQAHELEADMLALIMAVSAFADDQGHFSHDGRFKLVGAWLFFFYVDAMEKIHRTMALGPAWFDDPIYNDRSLFAVQDMLYRSTHPNPIERSLLAFGYLCYQASERVNLVSTVKDAWLWLDGLFGSAWLDVRDDIGAKASGKLPSSKWITTIPGDVFDAHRRHHVVGAALD